MNEDLYQEQIIEWSKKADQAGRLEEFHCTCTLNNPLCGDKVQVELQMDDEEITAMAYQVRGCLLCKASTAILSETIQGMTLDKLKLVASDLDRCLKSLSEDMLSFPDDFRIFYPVRTRKSRHSCVMLPLNAAIKAISEYLEKKSERYNV